MSLYVARSYIIYEAMLRVDGTLTPNLNIFTHRVMLLSDLTLATNLHTARTGLQQHISQPQLHSPPITANRSPWGLFPFHRTFPRR